MNSKILALLLLASSMSLGAQTLVEWEVVEHRLDEAGKPSYLQRFVVKGDMTSLDRLCFNQFDRPMHAVEKGDTVGRIIPGYYFIESELFAQSPDSVVVDILTGGTATQYSFGADGVHGVDKAGRPFDVEFSRRSQTRDAAQWAVPGRDRMPYGDIVFDRNNALTEGASKLGAYDLVPSFKTVIEGEGFCKRPRILSQELVKAENPEFYRIRVEADGIKLEGASEAALGTARRTVARLVQANPDGLPAATVEDWPDYHYRGMMIDVARNFQTLEQMKKFVDVMADYRLNRLQFHFIDDEAWRLEIPGLPELTEYGSRRGYTTDEADYLAQIYQGNGDPESAANHGMYTRDQFIDFLKYCYERGVLVIPEIETPGHSRAAVWAMENRYRKTGDDTYRLREDGDTSVYRSAQDFGDNVMNPALPGPHKFMAKVLDEVVSMYTEAGVPLESIHIGGDEVPHGGWSGSPSAQKFMADNGMATENDLHGYWAKTLARMISERGTKMSGWQEVGLGHNDEYAKELSPNVGFLNLWVGHPGKDGVRPGTRALDQGYPIVISDVSHFYLDLAQSYHPDERGLIWGGAYDEFVTLDGYPKQIAPANEGATGRIVGVQGQMWSETMRSPQWMEYYLFPRLFGVAERAWNADSTYDHRQFNRVLAERELPGLVSKNVNFRLHQPGVKLVDGKIVMNSPYPNAVIRFTTDGTDPNVKSDVYTGPFAPGDARQVRARLFWLGKQSVSSILNL